LGDHAIVAPDATAVKPVLRGWSHALAVVPALAGSLALVFASGRNPGMRLSLFVYGAALVLLFLVSALYHLPRWSPVWKARLRRADHSMIFVLIAGTYTPITGNVLDGGARAWILTTIWTLAAAGVVLSMSSLHLPRGLLALLYVAVGWVAIAVLPSLVERLGSRALVFLLAGGALYSAGAVVYAARRPALWPRVFGYHELFHLLVIAGTAVFFTFIATDVVAGNPG
jgi:hemolysin III